MGLNDIECVLVKEKADFCDCGMVSAAKTNLDPRHIILDLF